MVTFSLCMIVKDEEKVLRRCLDSVKEIMDEIVIVDTGSKDNTKNIAKEYTDKVYDYKWEDDFAKARNFSFSKATKDYIMWLDADDVILENDMESLKKLKENVDTSIDVFMLKYNTGFDEEGEVNFSYYRERILKRAKGYKWEGPIHEVIAPIGNVKHVDIAITHKKERKKYTDRNLKIFQSMIKKGVKLDPRQQFYYARELYYNGYYEEAIEKLDKFIDNNMAWLENKIDACIDLSNCYMAVNKTREAFFALTRTFMFDVPRAKICCRLGNYFFNLKKYEQAIYWYKQASNMLHFHFH